MGASRNLAIISLLLAITALSFAIYTAVTAPEYEDAQEVEESREGYHSRDWDGDDSYRLAQVAEYIAGDADFTAKLTVINIVINRVWDDNYPGTIEAVADEMTGGRYADTEPGEESLDAEHHAQIDGLDLSGGATEYEIQYGEIILK